MANIGRFDQPAQAQFLNTYVPIPFQELLQAGQAKQQQYNVGQGQLDTAQVAADQLQYIPGSEDERYIEEDVVGGIREIVDEFEGQDFSDPNVMRSINKRMRTIDRNRVNRIQQSSQAYSQYQQDVRKLGLTGKGADYLNRFDPTGFSSEGGVFSQTPEARLDYKAAAESYFNNMADKYLGDIEINPKTGMRGLLHGIPKEDLLNRAAEITQDYMNSPEGQQHAKQFIYNGVAPEEVPAAMQDYIRNIALEKGKTRVTSTYRDPSFKDPELATKGVTAGSYVPGIGVTKAGVGAKRKQLKKNIKGVEDYSDFNVGYVTEEGKSISGYRRLAGKFDKAILGALEPLQMFFGDDVITRMNERSIKQRTFKDKTSEVNFESLLVKAVDYNKPPIQTDGSTANMEIYEKEMANLSLKDQDELIDTYLENFQTEVKFPDTKEITNPDKLEWLSDVVLGEATDSKGNKLAKLRTWYDPESPTGTAIDFTEIEKDYPRKKDGKPLHNYTISHELSPYNPIMPSAYMVDIEDQNGQTVKTFYMSGPDRNDGSNYLESSKEQNLNRWTLYNQMFSEPTGRVNFTDSYKGEVITVEGMALNKEQVELNVRDKNNKILGVITINNPGSTEVATTNAVIQNLQAILSDIK